MTVALIAIGSGMVEAQTARAPAARQIEPAWMSCDLVAGGELRGAIASAQKLRSRNWLVGEHGSFAAYTMPGEKRNPFDLTPKVPDSGPRDGIVHARPPHCSVRPAEVPGAVLVRFTTPFYRFHEEGHGWSAPLRDGLMLEALVARSGETWLAEDTGHENSILLAEQRPRAADPAHLPEVTGWAEPMTGCPPRTKWNGETCAPRKR